MFIEANPKKPSQNQNPAGHNHQKFSTPQVGRKRTPVIGKPSQSTTNITGSLFPNGGALPIMVNNKLPLTFMITNAESINRSFTRYWLEVKTAWQTWTVKHRYREFSNLYSHLKHLDRRMRQELEHIRFPKKAFFKMRSQIVADRQLALQDFMNALCNCSHDVTLLLVSSEEFCRFIEMQDQVKTMLLRLYLGNAASNTKDKVNNRNSVNIKRGGDEGLLLIMEDQQQKTSLLNKAKIEKMPSENVVSEFLNQINQSSNEAKQNAIKEFDEYFFSVNPKLQEEVILKLFLGDPWKTKGILHFIGGAANPQQQSQDTESPIVAQFNCINLPTEVVDTNGPEKIPQNLITDATNEEPLQSPSTSASSLLAGSCLQLVAKLLNYSKNPQAEAYNRVFSKQDRQLIRSMKLESFIKYEKRFATEAMSLIESYLQKNPKVVDMKVIMNDENACDKYRRWTTVKRNYRDMGSTDRRQSYQPRTSFRRSKGGSLIQSGQSDDDILKRFQQPAVEEVKENSYNYIKDIQNSLISLSGASKDWVFNHHIDDLEVYRNDKQQYLVELLTPIEYDSFVIEVQNQMFLQRILQSSSLKIYQDESDPIDIYRFLVVNDRGLLQSSLRIRMELQDDFGETMTFVVLDDERPNYSKLSNQHPNIANFAVIQFYSIINMPLPVLMMNMHVVNEEVGLEDEEEKHQELKTSLKQSQNNNNSSGGNGGSETGGNNLTQNQNRQSSLLQPMSEGKSKSHQSVQSKMLGVRIISSIHTNEGFRSHLCKNLSRLRDQKFFNSII